MENLEQLVCFFSLSRLFSYLSPIYLLVSCQVSTIEFSLIEVSMLHGLKQGNDILKEIHKEMNVESVEKLLEETAEAREYQKVSLEGAFFGQRHYLFELFRKWEICFRTISHLTRKKLFRRNCSNCNKILSVTFFLQVLMTFIFTGYRVVEGTLGYRTTVNTFFQTHREASRR